MKRQRIQQFAALMMLLGTLWAVSTQPAFAQSSTDTPRIGATPGAPNAGNGSAAPSAPGAGKGSAAPPAPGTGSTAQSRPRFTPYAPLPTTRLRIHVMDGRTHEPLQGAEVVLVETEQRLRTNAQGMTPWFDAPVLRSERFRPMVQELHGQLTVIAYKNGYRDSIHMGIRTHEGNPTEETVWMYKIGPEDRRIEPVLYEVPYHHIWLIQLADKFRRPSQLGEGWQQPNP